ncbi:Kelch-like protein 10 [Collichthys lucidus]|uniref:Kelch-like protein 10 n=1 Tax=Collichthys lucidus TaxID=240159 RepID=A0A4U5VKC3_COLLU|nr:Kelch-like protein 10 [Collichthys lucidus]
MSDQPSNKFISVWNELRLEGDFCDAVIRVEDAEFQVHKIILCKCSSYFRALFRCWSSPNKKIFEIPGLSPDIMQLIIDFAYNDYVSVTEDNVQELLLAADQLNVMDLVRICCDFLGKQLCPQNCIGIWQFTSICYSLELQRKAYHYIIDHFEEVASCEEVQQLTVDELTDFLGRDDLNVKRESTVYEAIIHWVCYRPNERKDDIAIPFSKLRLALTSEDFINKKVISNDLMNTNPGCLHMAVEALDIIRRTRNNSTMSGVCNAAARPRLPDAILLAIGGWSGGDPTNVIEAYDYRADRWITVTNNLESPRAYHGTAFLNGYVYCIGGFDRVEHFNCVRKFDLNTSTWHEAAPMYYRRCYVSVTVLNGSIYAMGGYDGHTRHSSAECYRPETNQWSHIAPMHEQRSDASCTTLNNKIYICGGFNGNECLQTCEYYTPENNQWTMITPMSCRRSGIGIIAYADHVYAVGGFDGNVRLRSVEAYDPRTSTWHAVPSMMTTRSNFGIEVINDQLFVVGGFNGFSTSYNVESYDITTDTWSGVCDMALFRSALSCCVVSGFPNMARYTFPRHALPLLDLQHDGGLLESVESNF